MRALPKYQLVARLAVLMFVVALAVTWRSLGSLSLHEKPSQAADQSLGVPTGLQAATGGGVVAVRWQAVSGASSYQIYRNQALVKTLAVSGAPVATLGATIYYDTSVTSGQIYTYQVAAVSPAGGVSAKSSPLATTAATLITPAPTIEIDAAAPSDLKQYLQDGASFLRYWYPIVADRLVGSSHRVPASQRLAVDPTVDCPVAGAVSGRTMTFCAGYARTKPGDLSVFVAAATQVLAAHPASTPAYLTDGIAAWAGDWSVGRVEPRPETAATYQDAAAFSYFLTWAGHNYARPNLVRDLNLAAYNGTYSAETFRQLTGSSLGELWSILASHRVTSPGNVADGAGHCLEIGGSGAVGSPARQAVCGSGAGQQFVYATVAVNAASATLGLASAGGGCLATTATAAGATVIVSACNAQNISELWQVTASGGLVNPASGRCLRPIKGQAAAGAGLEIWDCSPTDASQHWVLPPA